MQADSKVSGDALDGYLSSKQMMLIYYISQGWFCPWLIFIIYSANEL